MSHQYDEDIDLLEEVLNDEELNLGEIAHLIVYNDEYNTFDWVIQSFIEVCGHSSVQAEQLAMIIHYKGKASVKVGSLDELRPMKDALIERGLSAIIETAVEK